MQYLLFSLVNDLILGINFSLFLLLLKAELLNVLLLLVKLRPLVTDLALESFKLFLDIGELVLCQLDFTLRGGSHLHDLLFIVGEFFSDQSGFTIGVLDDLVHHLFIVSLHSSNVLLK